MISWHGLAFTAVLVACGGGNATGTTTNTEPSSSSDDPSSVSNDTSTGTSSTAADSSSGSESTQASNGEGAYFDVGGVADMGVPGKGGAVCSSDLRHVVDGNNGSVLQTCPDDQGCLGGECVLACAAAAGSDGSTGCEFTIPTSPFYGNGSPVQQSGPCHALLVSNPWGRPAQLSLSRGGDTFDIETVSRVPSGIGAATMYDDLPQSGVPSGSVAVVFLAHRPGVANGTSLECPIAPAVLEDTAAVGTGQGTAFELVSDTPIQVYDIIPYGGAASYLPSASLIFPNTAWSDSYLVVSPHPESGGAEWMLAVARDDNTTVTIRPNTSITAGTIDLPPMNAATDYTIDAGEILQWQSVGDPVGSIINANRPIGVFTGNTYLRVTTADNPSSGQDSAHQMISDVNAFGTEYVGGGLFSRLPAFAPESVMYRLVGVVDGTDLTWEPEAPPSAPDSLGPGEVYEFESRELFSVRSQSDDYPFSLSQYMSGTLSGQPGCSNTPGACPLGDDEWVTLVAPQQFLSYYAFFVDPTYGTSTLVVTRVRGATGFADVEIECMGNIEDWQPVGNTGDYEVAHVELFRASMGADADCETSQHVASSDGAFGIMVWGTDEYSSYGYPAGGGLQSINGVVLDPAG